MTLDDVINVLLVEDSADWVALLTAHLHGVDIPVESSHPTIKMGVATTLQEAREKLAIATYDLILLDLHLPDCEDLQGLSSIITGYPNTPVIILSTTWDRRVMREAIEIGAQDFLIKMYVDRDRLLQSISVSLERHKRESRIRSLLRNEP